jgi:hypothetical protein
VGILSGEPCLTSVVIGEVRVERDLVLCQLLNREVGILVVLNFGVNLVSLCALLALLFVVLIVLGLI